MKYLRLNSPSGRGLFRVKLVRGQITHQSKASNVGNQNIHVSKQVGVDNAFFRPVPMVC